jgi:hypothetical protein
MRRQTIRATASGFPYRPDPSVRGLGAARLLMFSCPLWPRYRKGDEGSARALTGRERFPLKACVRTAFSQNMTGGVRR